MKDTSHMTVGCDISDLHTHIVVLNAEGKRLRRRKIRNSEAQFRSFFQGLAPSRVALEVSTHSRWIEKVIAECGHEVIVADARKLKFISGSDRKSDEEDAEMLARVARVDPALLHPVKHRSDEAQWLLSEVRARRSLVEARTKLINAVRGMLKTFNLRVKKCTTSIFAGEALKQIPEAHRAGFFPLLEAIEDLTRAIQEYDRKINEKAKSLPEVVRMTQIMGVGKLTALTFFLTLEDAHRFKKPRSLGAYLGLVPRTYQSGTRDPKLGITKAGNPYLRGLLVQCAHWILGRLNTTPSALRDFGMRVKERGGAKKAVIAVARKLSILLLKLWRSGESYEPYPEGRASAAVSNVG